MQNHVRPGEGLTFTVPVSELSSLGTAALCFRIARDGRTQQGWRLSQDRTRGYIVFVRGLTRETQHELPEQLTVKLSKTGVRTGFAEVVP